MYIYLPPSNGLKILGFDQCYYLKIELVVVKSQLKSYDEVNEV
jgi:hypothetical protein